MSFDEFMIDRVSILKADGRRFDEIPASVQARSIFINQVEPLIEAGDLVTRRMSNGGEETFRVIDPGFQEAFHGIPAGYQMKVEKLGLPEARRAVQSVTYNVTGSNARINHHSVDNSTNYVGDSTGLQERLAALRREVEALKLPEADMQSAIDVIDAVDAQFSAGKPKRSVVAALLAALPQAANIATVASAIAAFAH